MRKCVRSMWTLAILAGVGVSAWAQPPGPPGGPGGPGGPFGGGFGGGRGGFPGGGDAFLLMMPEVQKELGITEDQQALLQEMMDDLRNSMPRPDFAALRDLGEEERRQKMEEVRKQGEERMKQAEDALKVILDEQQFARHGELRLQRQGVMALTRPEVADKLQLTEEQKTKLNEIRDANMGQGGFGGRGGRGPGGPGGPGGGPRGPEGAPGAGGPGGGAPGAGPGGPRPDFQAMMAEMQKRREKIEADVLAVLTPEQKTAWEGMLGKKFDFPAPQFGGGRGPGGPGGPGGNRGGRPPAE